jgi:ribosomal protein S21
MPIIVKAKKDESAEGVIRRFKKKVVNEDVVNEVRKREFHVTGAAKRKERNNEVRRKKFVERRQREALKRTK